MKTDIVDRDHFKDAFKFAKSIGDEPFRSLIDCIRSLNRIRKNNKYALRLIPDFVKHSWHFVMLNKDGSVNFNGGLILHGFQETFSVELTSKSCPHWSIHT